MLRLLRLAILAALAGCNCSAPSSSVRRDSIEDPAALIEHAVQVRVSYFADAVVPNASGQLPPKTLDQVNGSGCVIRSSLGSSLIITANHVCSYGDLSRTIVVRRVNGEQLRASIVWSDSRLDLCVIRADGYAGPAASVAEAPPPLGALIYSVGGPLGLFGDGLAFVEQFHFAGTAPLNGVPQFFFAGITAHGASGSAMFYHGQVVGVLRGTMTEGGYIVVAANLDSVHQAILAATR